MTQHATASGAPLSALCFGTMQFGEGADAAESRAMFDAARAAGVNQFDTANGYTGGASETLLGQFAAQERDDLYIATKVGSDGSTAPANIRAQFDISRKRLGLDSVDLLYLHHFDPGTPMEQSCEAMADLQSRGLIRHIGISNYAAWQVMKAQAILASHGTRIDWIQPMYNLVKRQAEVELLPMALDQDIAVAPYSPLGGGLLTGKYASGGTGRLTENSRYAARYAPDWMHDTAAGLARLAQEAGTHPATLAVAWAAKHPGITAPIVSARSAEQLAPSLAAADFEMTSSLYADLAELSPTPAPATDRLEEA